MKITQTSCTAQRFNLKAPYTIAYETVDHCDNIFLTIETDAPWVGLGCAAPDKEITGETRESVLAAYRNVIEPALRGQSPFHYARIVDSLKSKLANEPSALAMVDMALFDLVAKKAGLPLYQMLGGYRDHIETSITIGIMDLESTLALALKWKKAGFRSLKIKGGIEIESDIERIIRVREAIGRDISLRFDANGGFTVDQAVQFIRRTHEAGIELFEQPTKRENQELLKQVSQRVSVPVMADESLMTLKDVFHLMQNDCTDMVNVKLMKVGGIAEAMHINSVAKAASVETMIGCMDESALAISAGLHFALACGNVIYADLDGHLDLIDDPYAHFVHLRDGVLYPSGRAGIE
jgi:L-alanine-DL-glutamate epimerase-like enolase superfamily enzyme